MSKVDMKVVFLGMSDVGKTSLVERFLAGQWNPKPGTTVGAAFGAKKVEVPGYPTPITLGIWDTAGAERYESMSRIYYRSARAACVCYDITNKESFRKVKFWVDELLQNEEQCAIYLVGTKCI
jgi:Ras-related protein Rab-24